MLESAAGGEQAQHRVRRSDTVGIAGLGRMRPVNCNNSSTALPGAEGVWAPTGREYESECEGDLWLPGNRRGQTWLYW